jgi:hypothetical protein
MQGTVMNSKLPVWPGIPPDRSSPVGVSCGACVDDQQDSRSWRSPTKRDPIYRHLLAAMAALTIALGFSTECFADVLLVEVVPSNIPASVPPGFSGTFELDLVNPTTNTSSFQVEGFQFELRVPVGSGVLFSDATTSTSAAPYIFSGNSIADSFFGGSLIVSPPPPPSTSDLHGLDFVVTPNTFTTLRPGDSFGLGLISFTVDASAGPGFVPISIIPLNADNFAGTQLSDPDGNPISFLTSDGGITIRTSVVPEPSSMTLALLGAAAMATVGFVRRGARRGT